MSDLLAIEASSSLCSVALAIDNKISVKTEDGQRSHTQLMLPFIDELLRQERKNVADLAAIAFAAGPGSFTGIRLAASVAKSLAYAAGIPLISVSSLAAIAQAFTRLTGRRDQVLVVTDARMGEVYCGEYGVDDQGSICMIQPDRLLDLQKFRDFPHGSFVVLGNAGGLLEEVDGLLGVEYHPLASTAEDVLTLASRKLLAGEVETALQAQAVYLRDKSGWKTTAEQTRK